MEDMRFESELLIAPVGHMISVAELSQVSAEPRGARGPTLSAGLSLCSAPSLPPGLPVASLE